MAWTNTPSGFLRSRSASCGGLDGDSDDRGPPLGRRECIVLVAAFYPGDPERIRRGADYAGNIDGDLALADLRERIVGPGIIVQRQRAAVGDEVIGLEPVLPQDDGIDANRAHLLDELRQIPGDLRIARPVVGTRRRHDLRFAELVDLHHPRHDRAARRLPHQGSGQSRSEGEIAGKRSAASCAPAPAPIRCVRPRPAQPSGTASRGAGVLP